MTGEKRPPRPLSNTRFSVAILTLCALSLLLGFVIGTIGVNKPLALVISCVFVGLAVLVLLPWMPRRIGESDE
jgi:hypothetical protein